LGAARGGGIATLHDKFRAGLAGSRKVLNGNVLPNSAPPGTRRSRRPLRGVRCRNLQEPSWAGQRGGTPPDPRWCGCGGRA
jgi:hypothetical protein